MTRRSFRGTVASVVDRVGDLINDRDAKDLRRELQRQALESSAQFVVQHLMGSRSFPDRISHLRHALAAAREQGDLWEFGVYQGETLDVLARAARPSQHVFGFDSFQGLPESWTGGTGEKFEVGHFATKELPKVRPGVTLVKGWFHESLPPFLKTHPEAPALVHVDCDLYSSTKTVLDLLGPRLAPGTVLVFDEFFNLPGWEQGEAKAFSEAVERFGWKIEYLAYAFRSEQVSVRLV